MDLHDSPLEPSENAIQAAGRLHNYADIRSARRSYQRTRKYPRKRPRDSGVCRCCFDIHYNEVWLARKKELQNALRHEGWADSIAAEEFRIQEEAIIEEHRGTEEEASKSYEYVSGVEVEVDADTKCGDTTEDDREVLSHVSLDGWSVINV